MAEGGKRQIDAGNVDADQDDGARRALVAQASTEADADDGQGGSNSLTPEQKRALMRRMTLAFRPTQRKDQ